MGCQQSRGTLLQLFFFVISAWLGLSAAMAAEGPKPLTPDDLWSECYLSALTPSPDGRVAAYVLDTIDRKKNDYRDNLYEVSLAGGEAPRQLTRGDCHDSEPKYSPDGRWIAFVSDRSGESKVYLLPRNGGEPYAPFAFEGDVSSIAWSPDSRRLCFLAARVRSKDEPDVQVITRYHYRTDGVGYHTAVDEQIHLGDIRTGSVRKLTEDLASVADPSFSPDGSRILFTANLTSDPDRNYNSDICTVPSDGGKVERVTETPEAETLPRYSPDGKRIAYLRNRRADDWYGMDDLWSMESTGRNPLCLTGRYDRNVTYEGYDDPSLCAPRWSRDGRHLFILLQIGPDAALFRCDPLKAADPVKILAIDGQQVEYPILLDGDRTLLHGRQSWTESTDVYVSGLYGTSPRRLTFHQRDRLQDRWVGRPEKLAVRSTDTTPVDAWMLKPPGFDPSRKYPLIFTIHGGPIWFYGSAYLYEREIWAGLGYVVLFANPRGSSGYGQAFADSIKASWGEKDYQDMMAAVDAAVATGSVDSSRMAVTGISYGGIMTNWIIGHTNRFCTAISEEGLCNFVSSFGTDDSQIDWESELGLPWENEALYKRLSPMTTAQQVQTPLLIIHGDEDYRTNVEQAEQWFTMLKRMGKKVVFLRYPRESHEWRYSGEPEHRYDRMKRVIEWWKTYLDQERPPR